MVEVHTRGLDYTDGVLGTSAGGTVRGLGHRLKRGRRRPVVMGAF
jgi:hypothetical protein